MVTWNESLHKIRTPIFSINSITAGGIQQSTFCECYGGSQAGKSSFCYQCATYFLKDYPKQARVIILDGENSANKIRLKYTFKLSPGWKWSSDEEDWVEQQGCDSRIYLAPCPTLEQAAYFINLLSKKVVKEQECWLLVVWDSISSSVPQVEFEETKTALEEERGEDAFKAGMMLRARVIKAELAKINALMWGKPITVFIINQIISKPTQFGSLEDSAGGNGLRHYCHYRLKFKKEETEEDKKSIMVNGTNTSVTMVKSKHSSRLKNIPILIQDSKGGWIYEPSEICNIALDLGWIQKSGGWYKLGPTVLESLGAKGSSKGIRWDDILSNIEYRRAFRKLFKAKLCRTYSLLRYEYQELSKLKKGEHLSD